MTLHNIMVCTENLTAEVSVHRKFMKNNIVRIVKRPFIAESMFTERFSINELSLAKVF